MNGSARVGRFLALAALLAIPGTAQATMTEVVGGPGGGAFSMTCAPGQFAVGFYARAGAWVDGIGLLCAPFDARARKIGSSFARVGWTGGQGGTPQEVYCAPGEAVTGIGLAHTRGRGLEREYVNSVNLMCQQRQKMDRCISSGEGCGALRSVTRGTIVQTVHDYKYDRLVCPSNEMATGIQGRSGVFVDAIGLICAPPPPAPPPNSQWIGKSKPSKPADPGYSVGGVGKDAATLKKAPAPMAVERPKRDLTIK